MDGFYSRKCVGSQRLTLERSKCHSSALKHLLIVYQDLNRFPSPILRVAFEGPDIQEQKLYHLLRVRPTLLVV